MTIAKIMQNHSFRATFSYAVSKNGAKVIGGNVAPWIERNQLSDSQLKSLIDVTVKQFMMSADLNPEIKRPVYHLSIALPPHENLSDEDLSQFCESFIAALILTAQQPTLLKEFDTATFRATVEQFQREELHKYQFSIVRHVDADHAHAHIVASKINLESEQAISTSYDYYRAQKILRDLERQYGLSVLENSWEVGRKAETRRQIQTELETGRPSVQKQIQDALDRAIAFSRTIPELIERLLTESIGVRVDFTRTGKPKGISYILDDVPMAGNRLGNRYSFPGLQRHSGLSYEPERDNDRIQTLCQQKLPVPDQESPDIETNPAEAFDDLIETIRAEYDIDQPNLLVSDLPTSNEQIDEIVTVDESEQEDQSVTDSVGLADLNALAHQVAAASVIEPIAIRLFEHLVEAREPVYQVNPEMTEWIYRLELSDRAYLISRDDTTGIYNVQRENGEMNLQLFQGITDRDLELWQDLNGWLQRSIANSDVVNQVEPESSDLELENFDQTELQFDWDDQSFLEWLNAGESAPSQPDLDRYFEPEQVNHIAGAVEVDSFWELDAEPEESNFQRQQRFAQAIAVEIRWLAQTGNINGNHYTLSQYDDHISLTRKDGQVIGRFPLDATQLPQGFTLTESDLERFQIIQQKRWAIEIGETVLNIWRGAGAPQIIEGQQYDVSQADGLLFLRRKGNPKPILEIPINSGELPRGQQLSQNDYEYFEQAKALLHQNEIEHDR